MKKQQWIMIVAIMLLVTQEAMTQSSSQVQEEISGIVTDDQSGATLPGVNVLIKGTTTGTSTNSEGNFELTVQSLQDTLVFSFVGYTTQEVPINGRTEINVVLQPQTFEADELVVTAFGVEREERSLTYSTQEVSSEPLTKAREPNVVSSLAGRVAGLDITNTSGGPGSAAKVNLRGNRSFTGNSEPLYVVDGVPIRGNPQDLSPNDIENVNVLKGGNAAALYGSAAQNGVIVITTNQAEAGDVNVSLSSNFTLDVPNILTIRMSMVREPPDNMSQVQNFPLGREWRVSKYLSGLLILIMN